MCHLLPKASRSIVPLLDVDVLSSVRALLTDSWPSNEPKWTRGFDVSLEICEGSLSIFYVYFVSKRNKMLLSTEKLKLLFHSGD